ncbi:UNVERIFIED_CONTAM: hypothetical protein FKN15_021020 [Acipenser sinensis]
MGYIMGKAEGSVAREEWHGHVTALSVAPEFRRLGLAAKLMELLEEISERKGGFFVDLFVRVSNQVAVNMYKQLGYSVYRTVMEYYSASNGEPDEDAYDMRKALSRDTEKKSIIPLPHPVAVNMYKQLGYSVYRTVMEYYSASNGEPDEDAYGKTKALQLPVVIDRKKQIIQTLQVNFLCSVLKGGFFVDLFVRVSNQVAVNMYKQLGYSVYRTVMEYYSASNGEPDEDAYDMRKALSRDTEKSSIIPLPHPVRPEDID